MGTVRPGTLFTCGVPVRMGPEVVDYDDEVAFASFDDEGDELDFNDAIEAMTAIGYQLDEE